MPKGQGLAPARLAASEKDDVLQGVKEILVSFVTCCRCPAALIMPEGQPEWQFNRHQGGRIPHLIKCHYLGNRTSRKH
ncbi:hypothetical protein AFLA_000654 [Aspergillus flavus NRRL3357]|nr:hypothetical protein AFLA_000654 [Aspergillus flavus NRRL3357]